MKKLLFISVVILLMAACSASKTASTKEELTGKTWYLEWSNLDPAVPEEEIRISFIIHESEKSISGFSGCNQFVSAAQWDKKKMEVGNMASTEMYCEGRMDWEKNFHQLLSGVNSYQLIDGKLVLLKDKNKLATFVSEPKNNEQ